MILNTSDPRVSYDHGWILEAGALRKVPEFSPHFDRLPVAGYSWINLSAYGVFQNDLIVGLELPREATGIPVGLTAVNYSGPPLKNDGTPRWELKLTVTE